MPPKKKSAVPDPPPPPDSSVLHEEVLSHFDTQQATILFCEDLVHESVRRMEDEVMDRYFTRQVPQFLVESLAYDLLHITKILFPEHDAGNYINEDEKPFDMEPEKISVDTWARGVIPVRKLYAPPREASRESARPGSSASKRRERASVRSVRSSEVGSRRSTAGQSRKLDSSSSVIEQSQTSSSQGSRTQSQQRGKKQDANFIEMMDEEEKLHLQTLRKELGGKDFTYDSDGSAYVVQRLKNVKSNLGGIVPKVRFSSNESESSAVTSDVKPVMDRKVKKNASLRPLVDPLSTSPMVASIPLASGVVLRSSTAAAKSSAGHGGSPANFFQSAPAALSIDVNLKSSQPALASVRPGRARKVVVTSPRHEPEMHSAPDMPLRAIPSVEDDSTLPTRPEGPLPPRKVSASEKEDYLGHRSLYPRDRKFSKGSTKRERLPPPVYPATRGHGFVTKSYLADDNPFSRILRSPTNTNNSEYATGDSSYMASVTASGTRANGSWSNYSGRLHSGIVRIQESKLLEDLQLVDLEEALDRTQLD